VYIIFLIHGVAVLMPWNMFINANDVSVPLCHAYVFGDLCLVLNEVSRRGQFISTIVRAHN